MSDPHLPEEPQVPAGTTRRPRSPRAQARQAARHAARQTELEAKARAAAASPPPAEAPPLKLKPLIAQPREEPREQDEEEQQARGMVCPRCGKYHDITKREVGTVFECNCGKELYVAPIRENPGALPATVVIRLRELYQKRFWSIVGMILAYPVAIVLAAIAANLLGQQRLYVSGTCVGIAAIAFLWAAALSTIEYRRTAARIAEEEGEA